jgi:N-acetylglucosaminyldiphosphoundecaprenol N-acetyl-beta-D-mannosaminyltransferase
MLTLDRSGTHVTLAGVQIDSLGFAQVVDAVVQYASAEENSPEYVVTPNAHHVVLLQNDSRLREIYEHAFLVVPDGVPLLWAAKLLRLRLNGRVNGTDLLESLCAESAARGLRVYFLGGRPGAADAAAISLRKRYPNLQICGTYAPPFGFEEDVRENALIIEKIRDARPHILFVGLGAPKQEYWMYANCKRLSVPMSLGIGVSFEFLGGVVARAPRWMQQAGLEWFFRLLAEPKRLWRRYVIGNVNFCLLIARQVFARDAS